MILINHALGDRLVVTATDSSLSSFDDEESEGVIVWEESSDSTEYSTNGYRLTLNHSKV